MTIFSKSQERKEQDFNHLENSTRLCVRTQFQTCFLRIELEEAKGSYFQPIPDGGAFGPFSV